ncbi:hypothetical protein R3P38DRAFT_3217923 [Favolaschia claudopus]|uniref:Uncharacterized protein n=1 Tax=Favolaschia claudopus TaxID=2862362 RepID=A0AAW0A4S5_9AGAR
MPLIACKRKGPWDAMAPTLSEPRPKTRAPRSKSKKTRPPQFIIDAVNDVLPYPAEVRAVRMSRAGRLILYPSLPSCTAHMLEAHQDDIWKVLRPRLGFKAPGIPNCYTSDPWYKVVVHDVPTRSGNLPSFLEQRNQLSSAEHKLRRTRFLDAISCADGVDRSPTFRCQPFESIWELETTCEMGQCCS